MSRTTLHTVGEVARISGVSVRTLHHYDEIGLLRPAARSAGGHRLYDRAGLLRLQQILLHRTLGFGLEETRAALDDARFDRRAALIAQRAAVSQRIAENQALLRGIDRALALLHRSTWKDSDMRNIFDGFDPSVYETEADERWGDTVLWTEATRRAASYARADWSRFEEENHAILSELAALLSGGTQPDAEDVQVQVAAYCDMTSKWFYPCDDAQIGRLAELYASDERYRANFERHGEGLSEYVIKAFRVYSRKKP